MGQRTPAPEEARAALAEAGSKVTAVRRADNSLRWMLIVIAAVYVVAPGIVSVIPRNEGPVMGVVFAVALVGIVAVVFVGRRLRAFSRAGIAWFVGGLILFQVWNAGVTAVSTMTGWWSPAEPNFHLAVSELVGVIPLIVAALLIRPR